MPFSAPSTKVGAVMDFIDSNDYSHFIVFDESNNWIGNIPTQYFYDHNENDTIEDLMYAAEYFFITSANDLSGLIDNSSKYQSDILPILSEEKKVIDIISTQTIAETLKDSLFLTDDGYSIIIEHLISEISFSKIAQLVESNNAKLLGLLTLNVIDNKMQLLLRTNHRNTIAIMNDLRRFGFDVLSNSIDDQYQNKLIEHSNYLNKFLNL